MADPIPQKDESIVIRTMKSDLEKLSGAPKVIPKKSEPIPAPPVFSVSQEKQKPIPQAQEPIIVPKPEPMPAPIQDLKKIIESMPIPAPLPEPMPMPMPVPPLPTPPLPAPITPPVGRPPVLIIPQKTIPPKEIAEIPTKPLFKAMPTWLKIGGIGIGIFLIVIIGLYSYWKIFIQNVKTPIVTPPTATTTPPVFPITPTATTTAPIKFFNRLPNAEVTIDISSKTSDVLIAALKSEATVKEALASVKQIKITYQGKSITTEDLFNLLSIFTPKDFLSNYQDEFALSFFSQKEGVRPILILKAKDKNLAENQMKSWETGTLSSDILPLFLSSYKLPKNLPTFKSYLFIGQPVHFLNISMPFASLNYAIFNDSLIFTTSSAGMFTIIQDLTGQKVSSDYLKSMEASVGNFVR